LILLLAASTAATLAPVTAQSQTLGPFQRGVPSGAATTTPISLSILDTINRALEHNLGARRETGRSRAPCGGGPSARRRRGT